MHSLLLIAHISAGVIGLLVGPLAMGVNKRRRRRLHRRLGYTYQAATFVLASTALGLVARNPGGLWWLGLIAVATEAAALGGWWAIRQRPRRVVPHLNLMCGSYISFVTAFAVVNSDSLVAWFLPTIIGSPLIALAARRVSTASQLTT